MADPPPPINSLEALGLSDFFRAQLDGAAGLTGLQAGRVAAQHRGEWDVLTVAGPVRAILKGRLYEEQERPDEPPPPKPTVGDWVLVSAPDAGQLHVIERTLTRRTHLERGAAGRRREPQIVVANVDLVIVVCQLPPPDAPDAVARRSVNPRRIERYLAAVAQGGARAAIALNKSDLCPAVEAFAERLRARFSPCEVITTSAVAPQGLAELRALLTPGSTVGLVGLSGVGKSSLVNALLGRAVQRTGAEREQDARGRHTTAHRELFVTEEGALVVDTPGMREFALSADEEDLGGFEDVVSLGAGCRFRDCRHRGEPGCAVAEAVLSGQLSEDRIRSYHQLSDELAEQRSLRVRPGARRGGPATETAKAGRVRGRPQSGPRGGPHRDE